ncbi:hypothetical protein ACN28S_42535 [Cystobacter fuscus]
MKESHYQLVRPLAVGGMAELFLGKTRGAGGFEKPVAIKRMLPHRPGIPLSPGCSSPRRGSPRTCSTRTSPASTTWAAAPRASSSSWSWWKAGT